MPTPSFIPTSSSSGSQHRHNQGRCCVLMGTCTTKLNHPSCTNNYNNVPQELTTPEYELASTGETIGNKDFSNKKSQTTTTTKGKPSLLSRLSKKKSSPLRIFPSPSPKKNKDTSKNISLSSPKKSAKPFLGQQTKEKEEDLTLTVAALEERKPITRSDINAMRREFFLQQQEQVPIMANVSQNRVNTTRVTPTPKGGIVQQSPIICANSTRIGEGEGKEGLILSSHNKSSEEIKVPSSTTTGTSVTPKSGSRIPIPVRTPVPEKKPPEQEEQQQQGTKHKVLKKHHSTPHYSSSMDPRNKDKFPSATVTNLNRHHKDKEKNKNKPTITSIAEIRKRTTEVNKNIPKCTPTPPLVPPKVLLQLPSLPRPTLITPRSSPWEPKLTPKLQNKEVRPFYATFLQPSLASIPTPTPGEKHDPVKSSVSSLYTSSSSEYLIDDEISDQPELTLSHMKGSELMSNHSLSLSLSNDNEDSLSGIEEDENMKNVRLSSQYNTSANNNHYPPSPPQPLGSIISPPDIVSDVQSLKIQLMALQKLLIQQEQRERAKDKVIEELKKRSSTTTNSNVRCKNCSKTLRHE